MKKLLGVLLAIAMSWPVSATVLKNVEVVGEIQTIASDVRQSHDVDGTVPAVYNNAAHNRVMAGLSADLVEDVTANLLFQYADEWGSDGNNGRTVQNYWNNIRLVNANVVLHNLFCAFDLTVGRQFYGDEDSAVMYFGPNHYNAELAGYANSVDAAKLTYADDKKSLTLLAGRVNNLFYPEAAAVAKATWTEGHGNIYGADARLHPVEAMTLQAYGYDFRDVNINDLEGVARHYENAGLYGAKLAFDPEAMRFAVEYARNFGGHHMKSYMVKADAAVDINAVTARGTFLYAKEGFLAFGNYTPGLLIGHRLGGDIWNYTDNGVRMFNVGFDFKPFEKWTFALDGFAFQGRYGKHTATLEADLTAKYAHNEYVELFAGAGYAKYGHDDTVFSKAGMGTQDNVKGQLGMLIKF